MIAFDIYYWTIYNFIICIGEFIFLDIAFGGIVRSSKSQKIS